MIVNIPHVGRGIRNKHVAMHKDVMKPALYFVAFIGFGLDSHIWSCHGINIAARRGKYPSARANTLFVVE